MKNMLKTSDVSIIIPAYITNKIQFNYLIACLDSAVSTGSEVIVVDDGSPVDLTAVQKKFPLFTLYQVPYNVGSSRARNLGVDIASNELIFPLDADDVLVTDKFLTFLNYWDGIPMYSDLIIFSDIKPEKIYRLLDFDCDLLYEHVGIASVSVLHTKSMWKFIGGWDEDILYLEDGEYNARLMYEYCAKRIPIPLVMYRKHEFQKTHLQSSVHNEKLHNVLTIIKERISQ
jgi:glycosyltransferase involved in cell wall biosynthesis